MGLYVEVAYRGDWWGEDPLTETRHETVGELFRALNGQDKAHPWEALGRCTGKVYVDVPEGDMSVAAGGPAEAPAERPDGKMTVARQVGWVFVARNPEPVNRNDSQPTGLREAWVTVHEAPPTVVTTYHYAKFGGG